MAPADRNLRIVLWHATHAESRLRRVVQLFGFLLANVAFSGMFGAAQTAPDQSQEDRGIADRGKVLQTDASIGHYYALVVGIDKYAPSIGSLHTAVNDAQEVGALLQDRYGFVVTPLTDEHATRKGILDALREYRNSLKGSDNLLIYFAGHGTRDGDISYWLPQDVDSTTDSNAISSDDLTKALRVIPSNHVLIISDSCYSGGLARDPHDPNLTANSPAFLKRMVQARSRSIMASGGNEPVADSGADGHSVFANMLLRALQKPDAPIFTASNLFYFRIREQVAVTSKQVPEYTMLKSALDPKKDTELGEFVFATKDIPPTYQVGDPQSALTAATRDTENVAGEREKSEIPSLEKECEDGSALDCYNLARTYQDGTPGVAQSGATAVIYYRKACEAGHLHSCVLLGEIYQEGGSIPKDLKEAVEIYRKACDGATLKAKPQASQPSPQAAAGANLDGLPGCVYLGEMYENGDGVDMNSTDAARLYRLASNGGSEPGHRKLLRLCEAEKSTLPTETCQLDRSVKSN